MDACQSPYFGIVAHLLVGCSVRLWHSTCAPHRAVFGPTPHPGRLASLCSPYVWRSATPSPLTAPAPCIMHALLLLVLEGELRCHFSLLFAPPAPLVQASTAAFGLVVRSCGRAVDVYLLSCSLGLGSLFTHSYGAVYVLLLRWSLLFLPPSPPSLSSSSPFTCALLFDVCTVTLSFDCMYLDAFLALSW